MHNVLVAAAILFAGIGGFIRGSLLHASTLRQMLAKLEAANAVMQAQSELIVDLMTRIDPAAGALARANLEADNA